MKHYLYLLTCCYLALNACSIEDNDKKKAVTRFDGKWTGTIKASNSQSEIKEISLTATFTSKSKNSGTFKFHFPDLPDLKGSGNYTDFGDRLMLHFIDSNLPFKETSEFLEVNYFLVEDSLMFSNKELSFFLKRETKTVVNDDKYSAIPDTWSCRKDDAITWKVILQGRENFIIEMRSPGQAASYQKGKQLNRNDENKPTGMSVELHVNQSNISHNINRKYRLTVKDKNSATLQQLEVASEKALNLPCTPA